jgi:hypothetical protein
MKPKRLPRLWCALQGLLPLEVRWDVPPVPPDPVPLLEHKRMVSRSTKNHRRSIRDRA